MEKDFKKCSLFFVLIILLFTSTALFGENKTNTFCVVYFFHDDISYLMFGGTAHIDSGKDKTEKIKYKSVAAMLTDMDSKGWNLLNSYTYEKNKTVYVFKKK